MSKDTTGCPGQMEPAKASSCGEIGTRRFRPSGYRRAGSPQTEVGPPVAHYHRHGATNDLLTSPQFARSGRRSHSTSRIWTLSRDHGVVACLEILRYQDRKTTYHEYNHAVNGIPSLKLPSLHPVTHLSNVYTATSQLFVEQTYHTRANSVSKRQEIEISPRACHFRRTYPPIAMPPHPPNLDSSRLLRALPVAVKVDCSECVCHEPRQDTLRRDKCSLPPHSPRASGNRRASRGQANLEQVTSK
ncbi:hypothetical protein Bbelb_225410 [Branchiostoma belcheri]|nr:hypothetical protein Bbelb_225410 [Branchiostoma belcheri]